jgi:predicted methyltransferase
MVRLFRMASAAALAASLFAGWPLRATAAAGGQGSNQAAEFEEIARLLEVSAGRTVADVGAGGGTWTMPLAKAVGATGRVYATEVKTVQVEALRQLARVRQLANVEVVFGTQQETGLPAGCCDGVLLRLVYHAFDEPAMMRASLRRATKPGGLVLIVDFRPPPEQLTREMRDDGFERVQFIERWQGQEGVYAVLFRRLPAGERVRHAHPD